MHVMEVAVAAVATQGELHRLTLFREAFVENPDPVTVRVAPPPRLGLVAPDTPVTDRVEVNRTLPHVA